jgi:bifunctional ADP-heptose synthase (sugar kinase/adenylyltransferase)
MNTPNKSVLVIGESCRDIFVYCEAIRLAPDLPVPVLQEIRKTENAGMALNVYENILSLYKNCNIKTNTDWRNITKTRFVHELTNHMFIRIDTSHEVKPIDIDEVDLNFDLIVITDYNKGYLSENTIKFITETHPNVFVDTKKPLGDWIEKAKFIKINDYEYKRSLPIQNSEIQKKTIITKGSSGAYFNGELFPVDKIEVKDTSGAGDSFMAALAVKYLETSDIVKSIIFANLKASEIVKHRGVVTI